MQIDLLDNPNENDNRNYNYSGFETVERKEYDIITNWITPNIVKVDSFILG
ncbi:MAG: hypothetical protein M0Q21_00940 [Ignavibacteriaceae bacterium]|nr:hypothetical protein [Ignavibacteriaceae bacterium]